MTTTINGVAVNFDFLDADSVERFENLITDIKEKVSDKSRYEGLTNAQGMRVQCGLIDDFFDELLGDGTAEQMFTSAGNLGERLDAFGQLIEASVEARREVNRIAMKYSPARMATPAAAPATRPIATDHLAPGGKVRNFRGGK